MQTDYHAYYRALAVQHGERYALKIAADDIEKMARALALMAGAIREWSEAMRELLTKLDTQELASLDIPHLPVVESGMNE